MAERVIALSLEHPAWGCVRLARELEARDIFLSSPTVQKILIQHTLGRRGERAARLEYLASVQALLLSGEQEREIVRCSPWFRGVAPAPPHPGALLALDNVRVARGSAGALYVHLAVDSYSHYGLAYAHASNHATSAIELLRGYVLPHYARARCTIQSVLTSTAPQYRGGAQHPLGVYLSACAIEHRWVRRAARHIVPALSRARRRLLQYLSAQDLAEQTLDCARLQGVLDAWMMQHNHQRIRDDPRVAGAQPADLLRAPD